MVIYSGTLDRVIDGSTIDININMGGGLFEVQRIRLSDIYTENIFKKYRTSAKGSQGVFAMLELRKWFYENSENLSIEYQTTDICGRWLSVVSAEGNGQSLNQYMKEKIYKNNKWGEDYQNEIVNDWFNGEEVTIPEGDRLPIFHIWGKFGLLGEKAIQINII